MNQLILRFLLSALSCWLPIVKGSEGERERESPTTGLSYPKAKNKAIGRDYFVSIPRAFIFILPGNVLMEKGFVD